MDASDSASAYFADLARELRTLDLDAVRRLARFFDATRERNGTMHIAGDGGSAALAQHLACDFLKLAERRVAPPVRSMVDNSALLTMVANDAGFHQLFSRQLAVAARREDALIVISGSGRSQNLLLAVQEARRLGIPTFGLLGFGDGGPLRTLVGDALVVATSDYRIIEDVHHSVSHAVAAIIATRTTKVPRHVVVLNRDGVLGVLPRKGEYVRSAGEFTWLPGAREAVVRLKKAGWSVAVATNQRGVSLGHMSSSDVEAIHERMNRELSADGVTIDEFYVCPHDISEECGCRKPARGMLEAAAGRFGVRVDQCVLVGDAQADAVMGQRAGCRTIIVGERNAHGGHEWAADLAAAASLLLDVGA